MPAAWLIPNRGRRRHVRNRRDALHQYATGSRFDRLIVTMIETTN